MTPRPSKVLKYRLPLETDRVWPEEHRGRPKPNRQLGVGSYAELVTWGQQAGVLSTLEADRLRRLADERPADAEAVYAAA